MSTIDSGRPQSHLATPSFMSLSLALNLVISGQDYCGVIWVAYTRCASTTFEMQLVHENLQYM